MKNHEVIAAASQSVENSGGWCSPVKAAILASIVLELRPAVVVEIGVWTGSSLIPMLLALKHTGTGVAHAIDAWSPRVSVRNEATANRTWWGSVDHDEALRRFRSRLDAYEVARYCEIHRAESNACNVPPSIDLLHVDGSHTDQAIQDVERFGAAIRPSGVMVMDDLGWEGGGVDRAVARARELGFADLYQIDKWLVMEKRA